MSRSTATAVTIKPGTGIRAALGAAYELTKPRITRLVAITSGVGFTLGAVGQHWNAVDLALRAIACLAGTMLSAAGANALNQWWERDRDALMPRTCARPLPQARLSPAVALAWGLALSTSGVALLGVLGPAPALVSLATILIYVLVYTPLKPVTSFNTLVGALPGALPPLIGWSSAASGGHATSALGLGSLLEAPGWSLVVLMTVWQIPHFLAIAWMYREDYALGGYRMLPLLDPTGRATSRTILIWSVALVPASIAPALVMPGRLGPVYGAVAAISGIAFVLICRRFARTLERADARRVFIASIIHLPVLLLVMIADAIAGLWLRA